jgi:signal transduction histidine kinase
LLERAQRQQRIQDSIISDLLDISRVQSNTFKMLIKPCNLVDIVQEAVEDQLQIVSARTITLELPDNKTVQVQADADRIRQVVTNYLTNALKYSKPDRVVQVSLSIEDHTAYITVHDEGPGFSAAEQESIWQRFYRVPGIEAQSNAGVSNVGLGVGLYLCKTIIEMHNGKVGVQSQEGKGSTFWFSLPLAEQE